MPASRSVRKPVGVGIITKRPKTTDKAVRIASKVNVRVRLDVINPSTICYDLIVKES